MNNLQNIKMNNVLSYNKSIDPNYIIDKINILDEDLIKNINNKIISTYNAKLNLINYVLNSDETNIKYVLHDIKKFYIFLNPLNNEYNLKLHEGDTLALNITDKWNLQLHSFDVVLGNPPYNKGGIRSHTGKQLGEKNETIWTKFIEQAFQLLKPNGFIVFINPLSWLKKSHSLHNIMLEKHIV